MAATVGGALAAGALAALLGSGGRSPGEPPTIPFQGSAPSLARIAELRPAAPLPQDPGVLRPVIAQPGVSGLRSRELALEPLSGGLRPAPPARIRIPAAHVDAAVRPVEAGRRGIEVPPLGQAGWLEAGPRPGEPGRAIVIGHLDTDEGPGLFARVPEIPAGTAISVTDDRGSVHRFNVVGSTQVEKSRFPAEAVYGPSRRPVLVLITCGGPWDGESYRDNVLVYARAA